MNPIRKYTLSAAIVGATLTGGASGVVALTGTSDAQTSTVSTTTAASTADTAGSSVSAGVDTSNRDAAHETAESAQQEADETAGKIGGGHRPSALEHRRRPRGSRDPATRRREAAADAALASGTTSNASMATTG